MAIAGTDIYGAYFDTGSNTRVTPRENVEVEFHENGEIDTGSKLTVTAQLGSSHIPHRAVGCPR